MYIYLKMTGTSQWEWFTRLKYLKSFYNFFAFTLLSGLLENEKKLEEKGTRM